MVVGSTHFAAGGFSQGYSAPAGQTPANTHQPAQTTRSDYEPATAQSPYDHVPDRVYSAFHQAAEASEPWVVSHMQSRLFELSAQQSSMENDWVERAWVMREVAAKNQSRENAMEAIKMQNLLLSGRGQPVMQPAEEQALVARIESMAKAQVRFLDHFVSALSADSLEAVA